MSGKRQTVPALRLTQWPPEWDDVDFSGAYRRKPEPYIYLLGLPAGTLRALAGINRRTTTERAGEGIDLGIQRRHDESRSSEISAFIRYGLPWSAMSAQKRISEDLRLLRKPGFLPTAIVINILTSEDEREGARIAAADRLEIVGGDGASVQLSLPAHDSAWVPHGPAPIEVIDGQHRLWAFSSDDEHADFELPVVAYVGLDIAWQAYLFYTINVKPKRINTSLAFDLYPLLRTEDWLERTNALQIYRETRAQELTEVLWRHPASPWWRRIDMLGEHARRLVSQAAWVRSLLASFIKAAEGTRVPIGGLFGARIGEQAMALPWSRPQQAALLIGAWDALRTAVAANRDDWARHLRADTEVSLPEEAGEGVADPAFEGRSTLLNTDQGVRGFLQVTNDLLFLMADELKLSGWADESGREEPSDPAVAAALASLTNTPISTLIERLGTALASYDWRTATAAGLDETARQAKGRFRGSSGYRELRRDLLVHLQNGSDEVLAAPAGEAQTLLGLN
jgi:DGQHR domain-containing protein